MKHSRSLRPWLVVLCALFALLLVCPARTAATGTPPPTKDPVNAAWQRAQESGVYRFATTIVETTHPAPTVANVGRTSREERMYLEGETNLPQSMLLMTLWREGGSVMKTRDGAELRIEGDRAYGREIGGLWREIDADAAAFAPGNDLMAYLAGARNVRRVGTEIRSIPGLDGDQRSVRTTCYAYDFNGPQVADFIRDQLEDHLREHGDLPAGLRLDSPNQFRNAIGDGEVWIDGDGWEDADCDGYTRELVEYWLSVEICHLSEFALLGPAESISIPVGGATLTAAPLGALRPRPTLVAGAIVLLVLLAAAVVGRCK